MRPLGHGGGAAGAIPARNSPERVGEGEERAKGTTRDRLVARVGGRDATGKGVPRRGGSLAAAVGYAGGVVV
jgi:hypothetical protein